MDRASEAGTAGSGARSAKDERAGRLAAALRENLRRRKEQARGRRASEDANAGAVSGEPSGGGAENR